MKPNFESGVLFGKKLMGCKMGRIKVVMNKPVYLGQAILDLSKIVMYEFHYDYMKPKYGDDLRLRGTLSIGVQGPPRLKLCYIDTNLLVYHVKTKDFYADIANDVEERFDTSGYDKEDARPLSIGKNTKVIALMKTSWEVR